MTTETPPDWVLLEAARLADETDIEIQWLRDLDNACGTFRALCDMIAKYEKPPVDRKVLCALYAGAGMILYGNLSYTEVTENSENIARACIRAIELYEGGFGK
jgi:hypothetical protein